jgi:hypothetical protein
VKKGDTEQEPDWRMLCDLFRYLTFLCVAKKQTKRQKTDSEESGETPKKKTNRYPAFL